MSTHKIWVFLRNKKDISIFRMTKAPYLLLCVSPCSPILYSGNMGIVGSIILDLFSELRTF